ncbi:MAG: hypothetical protein ACJ8GJ_23000 [Vitreoscilla sp.]
MTNALTPSQVQVLRRVRDGELWSVDDPLQDELREAMFLAGIGLLDYVQPGMFGLTELGEQYLAGIEAWPPEINRSNPPPA